MIERELQSLLVEYAASFRAVLLVGPRQSGKTTLAQTTFPNKPYVSLENLDERNLAMDDPRGFLNRFPDGAILDEVQRAPVLLNYLQEVLDQSSRDGMFILTGSNNILLQENATQSLAGRIGVLDLLPLSFKELNSAPPEMTLFDHVLLGGYPEIHAKRRKPALWYASYIRTYIERDVRQIRNIENLALFQKFVRLCAGRCGQQLNLSALSNACGIDQRTAQSWLSVLEHTFVVFLLQPFHEKFNKRIVKSPKLYFHDTGLACALLGIRNTNELALSHFRGALIENYIVAEHRKNVSNEGRSAAQFYWRDNNGIEIDLVVQAGNDAVPVEIKSAQTYSKEFARNLKKWMAYANTPIGFVVYDGPQEFKGSDGIEVINWRSFLMRSF
jgi:hypothetical protein